MLKVSNYTIQFTTFEQWDDLLKFFPMHTVFHTSEWLRALATTNRARLNLGVAMDGDEPVALWPIFETRKGLLKVVGSPLPGTATAYMGPLFRETSDVEAILAVFMNVPAYYKCAFFGCKCVNNDVFIDLQPFGFERVLDFETYVIDLTQSENQLWSNLKGTCRTQIRKARKMNLMVCEEPDDSFIDEYWGMTTETFAITHIQPTFSRAFLEEMWRRLHPIRRVRALSCWYGSERIATLVLPNDGHTMYYWAGAQYTRARKLPAHNVLHWRAIQLAKQMGLKQYDFISTMGNAGRFKRTFGPECVTSAIHWERTSSRLVRTLREQYEKFLLRRQMLELGGLSGCAMHCLMA